MSEPTNSELKGLILGFASQMTRLEYRITRLEAEHDELKGSVLAEVGRITVSVRELIDDKKMVLAQLKGAKWLVAGVPGAWLALQWALGHLH